MAGTKKSKDTRKTEKKETGPRILTQTKFSSDLDSGKRNQWVLDTLAEHYSLLVFKYVPAKALGQVQVPLSQDILAHFIMIHACACILGVERTADGAHSGYKPGFGDSLSSGDDPIMALDSDKFPDYPISEAEKLLNEDIKQGYTSEEKLRSDIEKIVSNDSKLIMIWDVSMQNAAKSHGEFKLILGAAPKSEDLKRMPKIIAELNKNHISNLLEPFRMGKLCPSCGWDVPYLSGITILDNAGDEMDFRYFRCENDGKYFVSQLHDRFGSDDSDESFYEVEPDVAKSAIDSIKKCPKPDDKHCQCKAHSRFY